MTILFLAHVKPHFFKCKTSCKFTNVGRLHASLHLVNRLENRVGHIVQLLRRQAVDREVRKAVVEYLLAHRAALSDCLFVIAILTQDFELIQRAK